MKGSQRKIINLLAIALSLCSLLKVSFLAEYFDFFYYLILLTSFFILIVFNLDYNLRLNKNILFFIFVCVIGLTLNNSPRFFSSHERLIFFVISLSVFGPLLNSDRLEYFRISFLRYLFQFNTVIVVASFIMLLTGSSLVWGRGGFTGLYNHSMLMGPLAGLSSLAMFRGYLLYRGCKKSWFLVVISFLSLFLSMLAGSRIALISTLLGLLFMYFKGIGSNKMPFFRGVGIVTIIAVLSFPLWKPMAFRVIEKMNYSLEQQDAFVTRALLWKTRIDEFRSSPFYGIGFGVVTNYDGLNNKELNGKIEPGSSWLVLLSMTGIIGLSLIFWFFQKLLFAMLFEKKFILNSAFFGGLILFFMVHMIGEGYILSAGSLMFVFIWTILGVVQSGYDYITSRKLSFY